MKTGYVLSGIGAVLLSGAAWAQAERPQRPGGPRGEGPDACPDGAVRERMEQRERMGRGGPEAGGERPQMREGRGPQGMGGGRPDGARGFGPGAMLNPVRLKEAGVTEQQLAALRKVVEEEQLKRVDLKASVEKAEIAFEQLMRGEAVDTAAALKAADALSQARAESFKAEIANQLKVREVLGAEVLKKLREMGPPEGMARDGRGPRPGMGRPEPRD